MDDNNKKGLEYLEKLKEKYDGIGQDFYDYLEGLVQSTGLRYWDYVHVDSLLGLQIPRTEYSDEIIFITYHQICELYFKLVKLEITQLTDLVTKEFLSSDNWKKRISRVNNYFKHICNSFDIMKSGMDKEDFKRFRMALLPASGFQAAQFRHIEIMSTNLNSLLDEDGRKNKDVPLEKLYQHIYWKKGGIDLRTGKKTLTLKEFEKKYDLEFMQLIKEYKFKNIAYLYYKSDKSIKGDEEIKDLLRKYDRWVNVFWKLSHLMASSRHLPGADSGTGGTNWRQYLPPKSRYQRIFFYETLWTEEEKADWGKAAVLRAFKEHVEKSWM